MLAKGMLCPGVLFLGILKLIDRLDDGQSERAKVMRELPASTVQAAKITNQTRYSVVLTARLGSPTQ